MGVSRVLLRFAGPPEPLNGEQEDEVELVEEIEGVEAELRWTGVLVSRCLFILRCVWCERVERDRERKCELEDVPEKSTRRDTVGWLKITDK